MEYRFLHPTHGERWIHHVGRVARRDATGRTLKSFGVLRDITQTKRAEEALRDLSRRLILAHEDERALLARELHDDVTQRLAVLAIDVGRAELAAPDGAAGRGDARGPRASSCASARTSTPWPTSCTRRSSKSSAWSRRCVRNANGGVARAGSPWRWTSNPLPAVVGKEAQLCLFRVAQEALNNVARHAGTIAASVTLRQVGRRPAAGRPRRRRRFRSGESETRPQPRPGEHARTCAAW